MCAGLGAGRNDACNDNPMLLYGTEARWSEGVQMLRLVAEYEQAMLR